MAEDKMMAVVYCVESKTDWKVQVKSGFDGGGNGALISLRQEHQMTAIRTSHLRKP